MALGVSTDLLRRQPEDGMRSGKILRLLLLTAGLVVAVLVGLASDGSTMAAILRGYLIVAIAASAFVVATVTAFDIWRRH